MTSEWRGRFAVLGWMVGLAVVLAVLESAGAGALSPPPLGHPEQWGSWVSGRDPVVAALAVLRLLALGSAWYLLAVAMLGGALRVLRARRLVALVDRMTIPALRRALVATAGVSLASGLPPLPALALAPHPPAAVAGSHHLVATAGRLAGQATSTTTSTTVPGTAGETGPPPTLTMRLLAPGEPPPERAPPPPPLAAPAEPPVADAREARTWALQPGECFWSVAEDVLARAWGRPPSDAEIVPYWRSLIEENRAALADPSNPDFVYPGQVLRLPFPLSPPG